MVASDALMRLSLVISWPPGAKGTLKSTRIKTRLFFRSRSRTDSLGIRSSQRGLTFETSRKRAELLSGGRDRPAVGRASPRCVRAAPSCPSVAPGAPRWRGTACRRHGTSLVCTEPLLVGTEHLPVFLAGGLVHVRPQLQRLLQSLQPLIDGHANSICSFCTPRMQAGKRTGTPFYLCASACICG